LGAFVPLPTADYAVIGTICNLKFVFMYWAVLFVIYRKLHANDAKRAVTADFVLLISVLTNISVLFILPFILWPYKKHFVQTLRTRSLKGLIRPPIVSAVLLLLVAAVYAVVVYLKGIPKLPGYLDSPYHWVSTIKIAYRVTLYTWLYPLTSTMRDFLTLSLLGLFGYFALRKRENRYVILLCFWAIAVATVSFVANRPGVSDSFITYQTISTNPDNFFYSQNLVFLFATIWLIKVPKGKLSIRQITIALSLVVLFLLWSAPFGSSFGRNKSYYQHIGTAQQNIESLCALKTDKINIPLYPNGDWYWLVSAKEACK